MSSEAKKGKNEANSASGINAYDPTSLLALYGALGSPFASPLAGNPMSSNGVNNGNNDSFSTLGMAASQAASLGMNPASAAWWGLAAQQLAAQEYMQRLQSLSSSSTPPTPSSSAYSVSSLLNDRRDSFRLPSDTEVIKYTSSLSGPKVPGTSNRGRKKTISVDDEKESKEENHSHFSDSLQHAENVDSSAEGNNGLVSSVIPSGLTIERKRLNASSASLSTTPKGDTEPIDRVEITKVAVNGSKQQNSAGPSTAAVTAECPLNLSTRTMGLNSSVASDFGHLLNNKDSKNLPTDYYASQALTGVFLAEQIRQQQLAAALENRLKPQQLSNTAKDDMLSTSACNATQNFASAVQTALLMNQLKSAQSMSGADTSKLLALAAAAAACNTGNSDQSMGGDNNGLQQNWSRKGQCSTSKKGKRKRKTMDYSGQQLENMTSFQSSSNSMSSFFDGMKRSQMQQASQLRPELTIEPVFKRMRSSNCDLNGTNNHQEVVNSTHRNPVNKYATVETEELRLPLQLGWRRETLVREYSKSGIRGDVVYYAPGSDKKFKQYPEVMRHLERNGVTGLTREHFSFSTRIFIGEFLKPTGETSDYGEEKYLRLNEEQMLEDLEHIRRENGWKPIRKPSQKRQPSDIPDESVTGNANGSLRLTQEQKLMAARIQAEMHVMDQKTVQRQQDELRMQKEALRYIREAEKREKQEQARLLREENKRKKVEQARVQKQGANRKDVKRQEALLKEQERERKRHHVIIMRQLEGKRRNDERERKKEEQRLERERERDRKIEQRRLESEIAIEMKKPIEDMCINGEKELPKLKRIENLQLCGKAFSDVLMVFEFLNNFGERLGFDLEALPSLNDLQAALLNDPESEEDLLAVLIHLLVCAIEDPGIPTLHKHLTILGQNLRQADITNTNVSEILYHYLCARGQYEVKVLHNVTPPDTHSSKDRNREIPYCKKRMAEFQKLLHKTRPYKLACMVHEKPFLCLNPTVKAEILAFVCNELLYNKAILAAIDGTWEQITKARKERAKVESTMRNYKSIAIKRLVNKAEGKEHLNGDTGIKSEDTNKDGQTDVTKKDEATSKEEKEEVNGIDDTTLNASRSVCEQSSKDATNEKGKNGKRKATKSYALKQTKKTRASRLTARNSVHAEDDQSKENSDDNQEDNEEDANDDNEDDNEEANNEEDKSKACDDAKDDINEAELLSDSELNSKIELCGKELKKKNEAVLKICSRIRATDLGQDRYRRRYWHFAHAGGVFVEAIESAEPWKLRKRGLKMTSLKEDTSEFKIPMEVMDERNKDEEKELTNISESTKIEKVEDESEENPECPFDDKSVLEETHLMPKNEAEVSDDDVKALPKTTANGDKLNLLNHSALFQMSLSPMILNDAVTITTNQSSHTELQQSNAKPWFSLLGEKDHSSLFENLQLKDKSSEGSKVEQERLEISKLNPVDPHIALLGLKLEQARRINVGVERKPIPDDLCRGWWRIVETSVLTTVERSLHQRGAREQIMRGSLRRNAWVYREDLVPYKEIASEKLGLELIMDEDDDGNRKPVINVDNGPPPMDQETEWNREVALRVDKFILEQVEALEDKVASASMQLPSWHNPSRPDIESREFRPSCEPPCGLDDTRTNPIEEAKERLLDLEQAIERRYLKAPLGQSNAEISIQTITSSQRPTPDPTPPPPSATVPTVTPTRRTTMTSATISQREMEQLREQHQQQLLQGDEDSNLNEQDTNNSNMADEEEDENEDIQEQDETNMSTQSSSSRSKSSKNIPRGLATWREAVRRANTAAQLAMAFYVLETSIAWHKSIMKAYCQICHSGEDEDSLLLCDGCDKGYHTYCFKPPMKSVPDGDWYCYECLNKATGAKHCLVCGQIDPKGLLECSQCPRAYHTTCLPPALSKVPKGKWVCPGCSQQKTVPRKKGKAGGTKKLKIYIGKEATTSTDIVVNENSSEDNNGQVSNDWNGFNDEAQEKTENDEDENQERHQNTTKQEDSSTKTDENVENEKNNGISDNKTMDSKIDTKEEDDPALLADLTACQVVLCELEASDDAWPFLYPVNTKQFPTYRKIIKTPMDMATVRKRLDNGFYRSKKSFCDDIKLIFSNCEKFNEDDSPVGKAGHAMRSLFNERWADLTRVAEPKPNSKRSSSNRK